MATFFGIVFGTFAVITAVCVTIILVKVTYEVVKNGL